MTNKEAQIILANLKQYISGGGVVDRGTNQAIDMAIKALEKGDNMRYCRIKGRPCAYATEYGYCSFTACREVTT